MASAEQLMMMQSVYGKVMDVDDRVRGVEGQVQGVRSDVQDVRGDVRQCEVSMANYMSPTVRHFSNPDCHSAC
jgi:hypothetical protein